MKWRGEEGADVGDDVFEGYLYVFQPSLKTARSAEECKYWHSEVESEQVEHCKENI